MMRFVAVAGDWLAFEVVRSIAAGRTTIQLGAGYACSGFMKCAAQQVQVPVTGNRCPISILAGGELI